MAQSVTRLQGGNCGSEPKLLQHREDAACLLKKGSTFERDVYIDHPYGKVMYRWDRAAKQMFIRCYGKAESPESVPHDNELVNEAIVYGDEISKEEYWRGK